MDATDVLRDRMQQPAGLQRMLAVSMLAHGALVALVALAPGAWFTQRAQEPRTMMTISLGGGTPGPENGGMTKIGGPRGAGGDTARRVEETRSGQAARRQDSGDDGAEAGCSSGPEQRHPGQGRPGRDTQPHATRGAETAPGSAVADTGGPRAGLWACRPAGAPVRARAWTSPISAVRLSFIHGSADPQQLGREGR